MRTVFILGSAALLLVLAVSLSVRPPAGGFDGRSLLALCLAVAVILHLRQVQS